MNDSSTTFKETEGKDSVEGDNWQLLVVVVAVMGTLMGVFVILGGVWVCVICSRRGSRLGKRNSRGQESAPFPPTHREMVELGCLTTSLRNHRLDPPPDAINNYSGISRGLGLGVSYQREQIPSPPAPHSWTPSPPFDSHQIQIPQQRLYVPQPESMTNPAANGGIGEWEHPGSALYGSRARTSPYNPRYNTFATDISNAPSIHNHSSSYRTHSKPTSWKNKAHEQWGILSDPHYRKCSKSPAHMTSKKPPRRRRRRTHEELGESERRWYQNPRICLQDPSENTIDLLREGSNSEPPTACSSCHGTPHRHNPISISRSASRHLDPSRAIPLNYICSDQLQESRTGSGVESDYQRENSPAARSRRRARPRLMGEEKGKTRLGVPPPALHAPRPHWMKHYQDSQDHGLWLPQRQPRSPLPTLPHNQQGPHVEHDQAMARRLALKYGFCPACGVQKPLKQPRIPGCAPYGHQQKSRYTQTEWDDLNSSVDNSLNLTHDPTPSMSWDNLTPDPSPVLTNTLEDNRALEALADVADGGEAVDELSIQAGVQVDHFNGGAVAYSVQYRGESSSSNGE